MNENRKISHDADQIEFPFLGLNDLITNKQSTNRDQDHIDIHDLKNTHWLLSTINKETKKFHLLSHN